MTDLIGLYDYAEQRAVGVYWFTMDRAESLSFMDSDGDCYIAMDPWHLGTLAEEKTKLAHELGHCETGSFYNEYAALDVRQKHENRANRWACKKLIPEDELKKAVQKGYQEPWQLAEYFDVTEELIRKAICWYKHGNMAVDQYQ